VVPFPGIFPTVKEERVIRSLRSLRVKAVRAEKHRGAWVDGEKVASIGIAVESGIAYHGVAINMPLTSPTFTV